jgi:hypothetical protein
METKCFDSQGRFFADIWDRNGFFAIVGGIDNILFENAVLVQCPLDFNGLVVLDQGEVEGFGNGIRRFLLISGPFAEFRFYVFAASCTVQSG